MNRALLSREPKLSTTALARALTSELSDVLVDCRALEGVVGEILLTPAEAHLVRQLQAFDFIIQRIECCVTVLRAVADEAPVAWISKARVLDHVPLSRLAARLSGEPQDTTFQPPGELEMW